MMEINSIDHTQEQILEFLQDNLAQPVYEESIPDGKTVKRNQRGQIDPYITVQFGDVYARGAKSMVGQRGHDYSMPFSAQVIAPDATVGRKISNRMMGLLLGKTFDYARGGVDKLPVGGAVMTVNQSDSSSQALMVPSWFKVTIQYFDSNDVL